MKRVVSVFMITLIILSTFVLAFRIQPVRASGTIYIRADGSIDPPTANITSADNVTYTFTGNIHDQINVERDNIVVDGKGYKIQGVSYGIYVGRMTDDADNVTIQNVVILDISSAGICLSFSLGSFIIGNNIEGNLGSSSGILLGMAGHSTISANRVANCDRGVNVQGALMCDISENEIVMNNIGIEIRNVGDECIYHNNFIDNTVQCFSSSENNTWDDGYPSGGNYWSDYADIDLHNGPYQNVTGSDGIGDKPYTIDADNLDMYPLMKPFPWAQHDVGITSLTVSKTVVGQGFEVQIRPMVFNYGESIETVELHILAGSEVFEYILVLWSRGSAYLVLTLDTSDLGNQTIWAYAEPVPGETDTTDNSLGVWVMVTLPGDVDGNRAVNIFDIVRMAGGYGTLPPNPKYNSNCDIDGDGDIDIFDIVIAAGNYGESW